MNLNNIRVLLLAVGILTFTGAAQCTLAQGQAAETADSNKASPADSGKPIAVAEAVAVRADTTASESQSSNQSETSNKRAQLKFPAGLFASRAPLRSAENSTEAQQQPSGSDTAELAKKLSNPVASLISFPIQTNFDFKMGTGSGWRMTTNIQPVIPIALNKDWNLISRTIAPLMHQGNVTAAGESQTGLGDIVQSFFFSPNKTEPFIWAVGPVVMVPTATTSALGSKQLGLGPTAVVLKQQKGWTAGALWNHIWRVSGGSGRPKVNADFVQPFLAYSTKDGWTYTLNTESTYDWTGKAWSVPIHFQVSKVVRFGKQPVSFGGAMRCWATSPAGGAEGCGLRIVVTGIFPKK
jgi:hypothetical protein